MVETPKFGQICTVAGILFPLTVESVSEATRSAVLRGENPDTGAEVLLPCVCLSLLLPAPAYVGPDETQVVLRVELDGEKPPIPAPAIGNFARLKSFGPLMTVAAVYPPASDAPAGSATMLLCHFFDGAELRTLEADSRTLYIGTKRSLV